MILAKGDNVCDCTPIRECKWSRNSLKSLTSMSKDDPERNEKIDLIARNTCDIKKRTVFCCDSEQTPKELTKQNFIEDLLTSPTDKTTSNISWNESEFCQLLLYQENHMNSPPFLTVSHEIKKFKISYYMPRTYKITSSFDMDCCWQIKKKRRLLRILRNNKQTSVFNRLLGVKPPFVVKKCTKKQRKQKKP